MQSIILFGMLIISASAYQIGKNRAVKISGGQIRNLHSLPSFYGIYTALWCGLPILIVFLFWTTIQQYLLLLVIKNIISNFKDITPNQLDIIISDIQNLVISNLWADKSELIIAASKYKNIYVISNLFLIIALLLCAIISISHALKKISIDFQARNYVENLVNFLLKLSSTVSVLITIGVIIAVIFEAIKFFQQIPLINFLIGCHWNPQINTDEFGQYNSTDDFGAIPLFCGTLLISSIAMSIAVPTGLMSAIYLSEYATHKFRTFAKPVLEILAGIPTIVYGFFAVLHIGPLIRNIGTFFGFSVSSESALSAGLVMGIMIIPFVSSLSDDVINAVPQSIRDGSYALGATKSETIKRVILPAALPGIVGSILLAVSRAIGETMIVLMAAGLSANLTINPLKAVTTVTVQIVTLLTGDQTFDSSKTLAAFALSLSLFIMTLFINIIALYIVSKYKEQYE